MEEKAASEGKKRKEGRKEGRKDGPSAALDTPERFDAAKTRLEHRVDAANADRWQQGTPKREINQGNNLEEMDGLRRRHRAFSGNGRNFGGILLLRTKAR